MRRGEGEGLGVWGEGGEGEAVCGRHRVGGGRDARLVRVDLWDGGRLEGAVSATVRTAEEAAQTYPIISKVERDVGGQEG